MRRVLSCLLLVLALAGCGRSPDADVVVTTNILGDLVRAVAGGEATVSVLMKADADPHSFGVSAAQAAGLERAQLIVHNGLGLEEGVLRHVRAARRTPALAVAEGVGPIGSDPHFWTDPRRVRRAVDLIAARIAAEVDGVDAAAIRANAEAYKKRLDDLDAWIGARVATVPPERRKLITNHHVFGYFAARYGFTVIGAVIPSGTTLASPSAADLAGLSRAVRAHRVGAIFADSSHPDRLARALATQAGLDVRVVPLYSESLTARGPASTYLGLMRANTDAIVTHLKGSP
ncbi:metal ABC transporter substrate-binding protein [Nonomuraea typhae]|uniref:metal ABC transporter substrate-binding protein n=1 Tax=Nonomuraea typhae TaxID=2603600 RepID=UPI0012F769F2|nr:metal ABC transporter substrate-binding protein [Nonomuraea typhae]